MNSRGKINPEETRITGIFFFLFFLCVKFWIDPVLAYQSQQPVFFFSQRFFTEHLGYPGGLIQYAAAFLSQFYLLSWIGSLILTLLGWILYIQTRTFTKRTIHSRKCNITHSMPPILLIALHAKYPHPLADTLAFILMLGCVNLYLHYSAGKWSMRLMVAMVSGFILYYAAGGVLLPFALILILLEIFHNRSIGLSITYALLAAAMPTISYGWAFIIPLNDAYFINLPFHRIYPVAATPYLLFAFYPLLIMYGTLQQADFYQKMILWIKNSFVGKAVNRGGWILHSILIIGLTVTVTWLSVDDEQKTFHQICLNARLRNWERVLAIAETNHPAHILTTYHVNRALFHTGRLTEDLFKYNQSWGINGLILPMQYNKAPLAKSDIWFELGNMNEALRWTFESLTIVGENAWTLQQLALINICNNEPDAAQKCLNILEKTPLFRNRAVNLKPALADKNRLERLPWMKEIVSHINRHKFLIHQDNPLQDLYTLYQYNPGNRMAREYLIAASLLTGRISRLERLLKDAEHFGYEIKSDRCEEALLIYWIQNDPQNLKSHVKQISRSTLLRFEDFRKLLTLSRKNKEEGSKKMKERHGDTFWYYAMQNKVKIQ